MGEKSYREISFRDDDEEDSISDEESMGDEHYRPPSSKSQTIKQTSTDTKTIFIACLLLLVGAALAVDIAQRRSGSVQSVPSPAPLKKDMPTMAAAALLEEEEEEEPEYLEETAPETIITEIEYENSTDEKYSDVGDEFKEDDTRDYGQDKFDCIGDRLENEKPLHPNEFICSEDFRFMFGLTADGALVWKNVEKNQEFIYHQGTVDDFYLLKADGTFTLYDENNNLLWNKMPYQPVQYTSKCLPSHNCPFLFLHNDGVLTIDYMDTNGMWLSYDTDIIYSMDTDDEGN